MWRTHLAIIVEENKECEENHHYCSGQVFCFPQIVIWLHLVRNNLKTTGGISEIIVRSEERFEEI